MSNDDIVRAAVLLDVTADALAKIQDTQARPLRNMYFEWVTPTAADLRKESRRLRLLAQDGDA